jgi:hypothetical protein
VPIDVVDDDGDAPPFAAALLPGAPPAPGPERAEPLLVEPPPPVAFATTTADVHAPAASITTVIPGMIAARMDMGFLHSLYARSKRAPSRNRQWASSRSLRRRSL